MKRLLTFLTLCIFLVLAGATGHLMYLSTHREFGPKDFSHPFILALEESILPEEHVKQQAIEILKQPFTYLSYGGQMTVYQSQDKKHVIKFFNPRSVISKSWFSRLDKMLRMNSLKWLLKTYGRKQEKLKKHFLRYEMAFKDLKKETGLVYVHLDSSSALSQTLEVTDKEGHLHLMDLDQCPFVLQKTVELTMDHLNRLLKDGDLIGAKKSVEQIYELFLSRTQKGYTDPLQALAKNYGFVDGHAVQIDVGRLRKDPLINLDEEMKRLLSNITPSLAEVDPELASALPH